MISILWKETLKWLGISTAFPKGGLEHLRMFKGLAVGGKKVKGILRLIWFENIYVTWKARNEVWIRNPLTCMGLVLFCYLAVVKYSGTQDDLSDYCVLLEVYHSSLATAYAWFWSFLVYSAVLFCCKFGDKLLHLHDPSVQHSTSSDFGAGFLPFCSAGAARCLCVSAQASCIRAMSIPDLWVNCSWRHWTDKASGLCVWAVASGVGELMSLFPV
ncbi:hypothetical protein TSUD_296050 [Trifolium subterraneum]|uniref:Uncharacterized protein n=1 Tax=Trifolium subterraneum TaxID=3900 RepID=A0A2Z6LUH0_TRISU|nr:hypothetical protein TSUD_296050 [Trifolium subterraneum]